MLNAETKRHIDSARNILVGVAPSPMTQVDLITTTLIYKFMDDMDQQSIKAGGNPKFFTGELNKYSWSNLIDDRLDNQGKVNLYTEALTKFSTSENLTPLFREVFKNTSLTFKNPSTFKMFIDEINYFDYSHSEELGNAFEYLLTILSVSGDAGQFRTPRNIIQFIVDVVDPKKDDKVLDPACGTAGFLVEAFNHILEQHDGKNDPENKEIQLTPEERINLMNNIEGYDITPEMARLSSVNLFLHGFKTPKIYEYDTLSSEEKWGEKFDVILANPPFMTPTGGIVPHSKFSIKAKRSEVLFVDYILSHLKPKGRAGIIVPEGVIFQSGNAFKELRKKLLDEGLYCVVSLPSGIFNPYSGVKTSILFIDKELAKTKDEILFVKIENDGFDLGAQRRPINKNDLPEALSIIKKFVLSKNISSNIFNTVPKITILASTDFNLSCDRYLINTKLLSTGNNFVKLGNIVEVLNGFAFKSENYVENGVRIIRITNVQKGKIVDTDPKFYPNESINEIKRFMLEKEDLLISLTGNVGRVGLIDSYLLPAVLNQRVACLRVLDEKEINSKYLFHILNNYRFEEDCISASNGVAQKNLSTEWLKNYEIPLPSLEIQNEIVEELDRYQNIIDGAKKIIENWQPTFEVDPRWESITLPKISQNLDSKRKPVTKSDRASGKYPYYGASGVVDYVQNYLFDGDYLLVSEDGANLITRNTPIAFSISGKNWVNNHAHVLKFINLDIQKFVEIYLNQTNLNNFITGSAQPKLNQQALNSINIPFPPIEIIKEIVEKIKTEKLLIGSSYTLIEIFERKIKEKIDSLWNKNE